MPRQKVAATDKQVGCFRKANFGLHIQLASHYILCLFRLFRKVTAAA